VHHIQVQDMTENPMHASPVFHPKPCPLCHLKKLFKDYTKDYTNRAHFFECT